MHPAIVAQAAATSAAMMPGRFFLGVGTGENLNEHVLGDRRPAPDERIEMLEEAVEVMRLLAGRPPNAPREALHTDHARLYTLPDEPPDVVVAGAQPSAALAGRVGDGFCNSSPDAEVVKRYEAAGGAGPKYGMLHVCYRKDDAEARRLAHELWPNTALTGALGQELATPVFFEQAAEMVSEDDVAKGVPWADPERHVEAIREFEEAGYTHVWVHQIGENQRVHGLLHARGRAALRLELRVRPANPQRPMRLRRRATRLRRRRAFGRASRSGRGTGRGFASRRSSALRCPGGRRRGRRR